jgi:hypothetical protein
MDWASSYGHLDTVKYLHEIGKDCTEDAMDQGVKWSFRYCQHLHEIGKVPQLKMGWTGRVKFVI